MKGHCHVRKQVLDVAVAQRKPEIQPDSVLDDLRREAVAAVADVAHPIPSRRFAKRDFAVTAPSFGSEKDPRQQLS